MFYPTTRSNVNRLPRFAITRHAKALPPWKGLHPPALAGLPPIVAPASRRQEKPLCQAPRTRQDAASTFEGGSRGMFSVAPIPRMPDPRPAGWPGLFAYIRGFFLLYIPRPFGPPPSQGGIFR